MTKLTTSICLLAAFFLLCLCLPARAAVIADLRGDYQTTAVGNSTASFNSGAGILDSAGIGFWNYGQRDGVNSGTYTLLQFGDPRPGHMTSTIRGTGATGYTSPNLTFANFYALPALSDQEMFGQGPIPAANELDWHSHASGVADLRWTAGASEAGLLTISGAFNRIGAPTNTPSFYVYVDGVQKASFLNVVSGVKDPFNFTTTINSGSQVDFIMSGGGGDLESAVSAQIATVPEPSTFVLGGLGLLGMGVAARRKQNRVASNAAAA